MGREFVFRHPIETSTLRQAQRNPAALLREVAMRFYGDLMAANAPGEGTRDRFYCRASIPQLAEVRQRLLQCRK
jgi:hypothetical protein